MSKKSLISGITLFKLVFLFLLVCIESFAREPSIQLGIDYLEESKFSVLQGKRVGLLTHPAGKNGGAKVLWMFLFAHLMST